MPAGQQLDHAVMSIFFRYLLLLLLTHRNPSPPINGIVIQERQHTVTMLAQAHSAAHITAAKKPFLVYGTAWKKELTSKYVWEAIRAGFRFVDTACQVRGK